MKLLAVVLLIACSPKAKQKIKVIYDGKTAFACDATEIEALDAGFAFDCDGRKLVATYAAGALRSFTLPTGQVVRTVDATDYDCPDAPPAALLTMRDGHLVDAAYRYQTADPCAVLTLELSHGNL